MSRKEHYIMAGLAVSNFIFLVLFIVFVSLYATKQEASSSYFLSAKTTINNTQEAWNEINSHLSTKYHLNYLNVDLKSPYISALMSLREHPSSRDVENLMTTDSHFESVTISDGSDLNAICHWIPYPTPPLTSPSPSTVITIAHRSTSRSTLTSPTITDLSCHCPSLPTAPPISTVACPQVTTVDEIVTEDRHTTPSTPPAASSTEGMQSSLLPNYSSSTSFSTQSSAIDFSQTSGTASTDSSYQSSTILTQTSQVSSTMNSPFILPSSTFTTQQYYCNKISYRDVILVFDLIPNEAAGNITTISSMAEDQIAPLISFPETRVAILSIDSSKVHYQANFTSNREDFNNAWKAAVKAKTSDGSSKTPNIEVANAAISKLDLLNRPLEIIYIFAHEADNGQIENSDLRLEGAFVVEFLIGSKKNKEKNWLSSIPPTTIGNWSEFQNSHNGTFITSICKYQAVSAGSEADCSIILLLLLFLVF